MQWVGNGDRAHAACQAMDNIAQRAEDQLRTQDASQTFAGGLEWFCEHVKGEVLKRKNSPDDVDEEAVVELHRQVDDVVLVYD